MRKKQVFCPSYMSQNDRDKLEQHGRIIETAWDAWYFVANENDNTTVFNGNHCLNITIEG